jgi:hypothetical protein
MTAFAALPPLTEQEEDDPGAAIERRRLDTVQQCAFCHERALFAYVTADPLLVPPRWVDACGPHSHWLRGGPWPA